MLLCVCAKFLFLFGSLVLLFPTESGYRIYRIYRMLLLIFPVFIVSDLSLSKDFKPTTAHHLLYEIEIDKLITFSHPAAIRKSAGIYHTFCWRTGMVKTSKTKTRDYAHSFPGVIWGKNNKREVCVVHEFCLLLDPVFIFLFCYYRPFILALSKIFIVSVVD